MATSREVGGRRGRDDAPWRVAPALGPALAFGVAVAAGRGLVEPRPLAAAALLAVALAAAGPVRRLGAAVALGLLLAAWGGDGEPPRSGRPVELVGTVDGEWRRDVFGWRAWMRVERYRQATRVVVWRAPILVRTGGEERPPPARSLRLRGTLSRRSAAGNPGARRAGPWTLVVPRRLLSVEEVQSGTAAALGRLRARLDGGLLALGHDRPGVRLARALVLGHRDALEEEWQAGLRRLGLAHVAALSGLHVALVAALALGAARPLPTARLRLAASGLAVLAYVATAGARPSLLRAGAMAMVVLTCAAAERRHVAWNALALAAAGLVAWRPEWVEDAGFLLSVAATAGLLWGAAERQGVGRVRPRWPSRALCASLCAQLAAAPWILSLFCVVQPLAPLWNLAAAPWLTCALLISLGLVVAAASWAGAAAVLLPLADAAAAPLAWAALRPPDRLVTLAAPGFVAALALTAAALAAWRRRPAPTLGALLALVALARWGGSRAPDPELALLDVGQGTAVLVRQGREAVLVDGGGWPTGDVARSVTVPALASLGLDRLRAVILTHPDLDHCRGLLQTVRVVATDEVWTAPGWPPSDCLGRLATTPGPRLRVLLPGDELVLGEWRLTILHPSPAAGGGDNDRSLVLRAVARGRAVLLTGDLQAAGERDLMGRWGPEALRADVLVVPHHGSRTSTTGAFLDAVDPRLALVSAGRDNRFGHPHGEVLERLHVRGVPWLATARSGWIRLSVDSTRRLRLATPAAPVGG
jgi:competence protein ComEC